MDDLRNVIPNEIINLIISWMNTATKRKLRSTNKYWLQFITFDEFTIYFARPKTLPNILQHFSQVYGPKLLGLSFKKIVSHTVADFPIQELLPLTQLTSLSFDFEPGRTKTYASLTSLSNLISLTPELWHYDMDGKLLNLTKLYVGELATFANLGLYANLQHLAIRSYSYSGNPFRLLGNLTKLTHLSFEVKRLEWTEDVDANIMTRFSNLRSLEVSLRKQQTLPTMFKYLTAIERLESTNAAPQEDFFKLTRLTHLHLRDVVTPVDSTDQLSSFCNLKYLYLNHLEAPKDYSFLKALTALEELDLYKYSNTPILSDGLLFINSQKLTRLDVETTEAFNIDNLAGLTSLEYLFLEEITENHIAKSYDGLTNLTRLTCFYLATQTSNSIRFTVLTDLVSLKVLQLDNSMDNQQKVPFLADLSLSNLTNLEAFALEFPILERMYNDLSILTCLTSLSIKVDSPVVEQDPTALCNLTNFRRLNLKRKILSPEFWTVVTTLTNLEFLGASNLKKSSNHFQY